LFWLQLSVFFSKAALVVAGIVSSHRHSYYFSSMMTDTNNAGNKKKEDKEEVEQWASIPNTVSNLQEHQEHKEEEVKSNTFVVVVKQTTERQRHQKQKESVLENLDWEEPQVYVTWTGEKCEITMYQGLKVVDDTSQLKYTIQLTLGAPPQEEDEEKKWETTGGTGKVIGKTCENEDDIKEKAHTDELNAALEAEEQWCDIANEEFIRRHAFFRTYNEIARFADAGGMDWSLKQLVEFKEREEAKRLKKYQEAKRRLQLRKEKGDEARLEEDREAKRRNPNTFGFMCGINGRG